MYCMKVGARAKKGKKGEGEEESIDLKPNQELELNSKLKHKLWEF